MGSNSIQVLYYLLHGHNSPHRRNIRSRLDNSYQATHKNLDEPPVTCTSILHAPKIILRVAFDVDIIDGGVKTTQPWGALNNRWGNKHRTEKANLFMEFDTLTSMRLAIRTAQPKKYAG